MAEEFITNLPPEIIINILSRLPVRTVTTSKCVCKPWLDLIETPQFAKSHLSKSVPGLVVNQFQTREKPYNLFKIFDFEETSEEHRFNLITEIDFLVNPLSFSFLTIQGSANGLLFFRRMNFIRNDLYVCNPITRDYINLPNPERITKNIHTEVIFGFGVSKITDQYKVVSIVVESKPAECEVYTLGTGTWRSVACNISFEKNCSSVGTFHNGKLHWLIPNLKGCLTMITSFDLETETFCAFSPSPPCLPEGKSYVGEPKVFDGCMYLCDNCSDDEMAIWMMKNEQWGKELIISKHPNLAHPLNGLAYPAMVFRDGDILLMGRGCKHLCYYSSKNRTTRVIAMVETDSGRIVDSILHTSSFVSLKSFTKENVISFKFGFNL